MRSPSNSGGIVECILLPYNDLTMPHHFFGPNLESCISYLNLRILISYLNFLIQFMDAFVLTIDLPRPQALIKFFYASHYMKGLHEVVRHILGAQRGVGYERSG